MRRRKASEREEVIFIEVGKGRRKGGQGEEDKGQEESYFGGNEAENKEKNEGNSAQMSQREAREHVD